MAKKYTSDDITTLSLKEYVKFRVFEQMEIDYLSLIKGFILDPPISTQKDDDSISIHFFFVDEGEVAEIFKTICEKFTEKLKINNDVGIHKFQTGHFEIESKSLSAYLKEVNFSDKMSVFEPFNYFSPNTFLDDKQKFSFLLGQYIRFYKNDKCVLIDSWKSYVVMDIIKSFCISQDELKSKTYFGVPGVTQFFLSPDSVLLEYLEYWKKKMM